MLLFRLRHSDFFNKMRMDNSKTVAPKGIETVVNILCDGLEDTR